MRAIEAVKTMGAFLAVACVTIGSGSMVFWVLMAFAEAYLRVMGSWH